MTEAEMVVCFTREPGHGLELHAKSVVCTDPRPATLSATGVPGPIIEPHVIAAALDLLHRAAVELAQPMPPDPDLATATADSLRAHVRNLERSIEDRVNAAIRVDQELVQLRAENRTLRDRLAAKGGK